jgi:hypothetical protein
LERRENDKKYLDVSIESMTKFFNKEEINNIARETGFIKREREITGWNFLLTFTVGLFHLKKNTLNNLAVLMCKVFGISMTKQSLHDATIKGSSAEFLKRCFERALQKCIGNVKLDIEKLSMFTACFIIDSTNGQLHPALAQYFKGSGGSASEAGFRIQYVFEFLHGICEKLEIGGSKLTDAGFLGSLLKGKVVEKALYMFDLGYFKIAHFVEIAKAGAYFISRFKISITLCLPGGEPFQLEDHLKTVKGNTSEVSVVMTNQAGKKIQVRLICIRVPQQVADERRRKEKAIAQKKGYTVSEAKLRLLDWNFFITNVPADIWKAEEIRIIYKIRWQVELVFKTWKSLLKLQCLNTTKKERVYCELYGKLIVAVLLTNMSIILTIAVRPGKEISTFKLIKMIQDYALDWLRQINQAIFSHVKFFKDNIPLFLKYCYKEENKKKKTTITLIDNLNNKSKCQISTSLCKMIA